MYAIIIDENTKLCEVGLGTNEEYYKSLGMTEMEVEQAYNGNWYVAGYAPQKPAPTEEEQRQKRAEAYRLEKDPITCQITSLRDKEQTPEIIKEINELIQKRAEVVTAIQERYPYPVDNDPEYDVIVEG